jgi:hypothetical protein
VGAGVVGDLLGVLEAAAVGPVDGLSRTFDDSSRPIGAAVLDFPGILGRSGPAKGRLHRKCGRTQISSNLTDSMQAGGDIKLSVGIAVAAVVATCIPGNGANRSAEPGIPLLRARSASERIPGDHALAGASGS